MDCTGCVSDLLSKWAEELCVAAYRRKKCCFCVELEIGSLIIGYINLIGSVVLVILYLFLVLNEFSDDETISPEGYRQYLIPSIFTLDIIFGIILLVGLHKGGTCRIKIWFIFIICYIVINIFLAFDLWDEILLCTALSKVHSALVIKTYLSVLTDDSSSNSSNDNAE